MTHQSEKLANSVNTTADSVVDEVKTPSVHPAVGVAGVSTIGGFLGALVAGPLGALLGGTIGALSASYKNSKSVKSGYYATQTRNPARVRNDAMQVRKELAQDLDSTIDKVQDSVQQGASNLASTAQATVSNLSNNLSVTEKNRQLKGILLDIDGTLVISNDAQAQAWVEAFAGFGYEIQFDQIRPLIGMGGDQVVPRMVPDLSGEAGVGKEIADRRKELILNKFGANLSTAPGSRDLILKLKQEGFQLVVASSATSEELSTLLRAAQVEDLLSQEPATTADDADHSKPAPDLVQAALSQGHLAPEQAIMLGDTPYDIEAAKKAGVKVIALRCGGFDDSQLAGAVAIYDHPADLLADFEQSPIAQYETLSIAP